MIKIVPDTNIMLKGMFGYLSPERKILSLGLLKKIQLVGCQETYNEFHEKIVEPRFQKYWKPKNFSHPKLLLDYKALVVLQEPLPEIDELEIPISDPDDKIFIKIALSSNSKIIVTTDNHLLSLNGFKNLRIVRADKFIESFNRI